MNHDLVLPETAELLRRWFRRDVKAPLEHAVGGPARLKVITLLACVLALNAADMATVGAVAAPLEHALHISNLDVGWLVAMSTGIGALVTLPFGALADRVRRTYLLVATIAVWSLAMAVGGGSVNYPMLLVSRLFLGAAVAAASPAVISLTGDFFHPGERGRVFGYILAGELVGAGFGLLISGNVAAVLSWRAAFWILASLGIALAWAIWRLLPEPARGGQSQIPVGSQEVPAADAGPADVEPAPAAPAANGDTHDRIREKIKERDVAPHASQIPHRDPADMRLWPAVRYILRVRTFRGLVIASALGYFYFTGLRTFAVVFMRARFHLGQSLASSLTVAIGLGAVLGVLAIGRLGDALIARDHLRARVVLGGVAYLLAAAAFVPGLLTDSLYFAGPCFFVAAIGIGGANPVVDAARLDVMPAHLWGRAEGVRATLRLGLVAIAPPLFGYVSGWFSASAHAGAGSAGAAASSSGAGLQPTLLLMLVALVAAGLLLWFRASKTYLRDVATALATERENGRGP